MTRRAAMVAGLVCAVLLALLAGTGWAARASRQVIERASAGRVFDAVSDVPHRKVALVLGCAPRFGRYPNPFFTARIDAAVALFRAGKADYLLVSGDNRRADYDEPTAMKAALMAAGVPEPRIYCDYAGRRTLDSVVRAKEVFGQSQFIVVSQKFHNQRAVFIASHRGIDAVGFNAADVNSRWTAAVMAREAGARMKAVFDIYVLQRQPHFLGAHVEIGEKK